MNSISIYITWFVLTGLAFFAGLKIGKPSGSDAGDNPSHSRNLSRASSAVSNSQSSMPASSRRRGSNKSAVSELLNTKDPKERFHILLSSLSRFSEQDLVSIINKYATDHTYHRLELEFAIEELVSIAPSTALDLINESPIWRLRSQLGDALVSLSEYDPNSVIEWIAEAKGDQSTLLLNVIQGAAKTSPDKALYLASEIEDQRMKAYAVGLLIKPLAKLPLSEAWDYCLKHSPSNTAALIGALPPESLPDVVQLLPSIESKDQRDWTTKKLAKSWAYRDQVATRKWLETMPIEDAASITAEISTKFRGAEASELSDWMLRFKDTNHMGAISNNFIRYYRRTNPQSAAKLIRYAPSDKRSSLRDLIYHGWKRSDPEAAQKFLQEDRQLHP